MAGLGGLPYYLQYQQAAQQQANQNQAAKIQLAQFQAAQQKAQQERAAQIAAGNALPQLLAGGQLGSQPQMSPPPQAPAPGQASQPMQQPGPQMQGGGMPPLPPGTDGTAPLPGQGPAPAGPARPPLPPFQAMPTSPPPQAAQGGAGIAPPPSQPVLQQPQQQQGGGPLTLQSAVQVLQSQGLQGADLMAGLQQLMPVMDAQSKAQAAAAQMQFNHGVKMQQMDLQRDSLEARIAAAKDASEDRKAGRAERMQAHQDSMSLQRQLMDFRIQQAKAKQAGDPDAKLDPETIHILAEQAMAGDTSVYQNLGRGVQGAQNIVAIRKEVARMTTAKGGTGADIAAGNVAYGGEKAAARSTAVASSKQAQAADEASTLADQAMEVSQTISRTNAPTINAGLNTLRKQGGNADVSRFNVAINGFKNTYSRAISPTGTPTVHDKQHADELFSMDQSPAQFAASIEQAKKEMAAAISAPGHVQEKQRARIAGRSESTADTSGGIPSGWTVKEH